jgi:hypothetical protein
MELSLFFLALAVWFLVSAVSRAGRSSTTGPRNPGQRPPRSVRLTIERGPAQHQGRAFELMLRELQRTLEDAGASHRSSTQPSLPSVEGGSLEDEAEAVSLEEDISRQPVDLDEEAEEIVARRIGEAEARNQGGSAPQLPSATEKIRPEPADKTGTHGYTRRQLRDAVVWQEILGAPVSER